MWQGWRLFTAKRFTDPFRINADLPPFSDQFVAAEIPAGFLEHEILYDSKNFDDPVMIDNNHETMSACSGKGKLSTVFRQKRQIMALKF
jgi:hypothetical protein